ncbi:hypothetical protein [Nitrosomonas sp.]|uniref:hypothetical protein n=1 Tax=Nitrosomonas sp. TaxID=42353 RepID=UPI0025F7F7EB|nr:hypothetical protein [Nitrosomonas sp.]MBV6448565.1 hypothetical protein [Nitrosomonas sp.]
MIRLIDSPTSADRVEITAKVYDRLHSYSSDDETRDVVRDIVDVTLSVLDPADRARRPRHHARCVDDEGKIECVCGLDDHRQEMAEAAADRMADEMAERGRS